MAFFDSLNTFSDSLRSVNQSMGLTLDKMEQQSLKKVHNFESLNKGISLTNKHIHNMSSTFDESFSPSIGNTNDLMSDLNKSTKDAFGVERVQNWEAELDKVLDSTELAKEKYSDFHMSVAQANEDMAQTMDTIASTSSQAVISAWKEKEFAARSFGSAVSTVSDSYTQFLSIAKEGVARSQATKMANEELAKTFEDGTEQHQLAAQAAEQAGTASEFLSQNLYTVALGAAAATAALVGLYAITSKAAELQTELRDALRDTNMTWQEQDMLMGQLAMDAAFTGQTISTLADNYAVLYSQQLAGAEATENYTDALNVTTVALGMSAGEAGDLAFTYGKVFKAGVEGFEGVASAVKAAGMQTSLTTQEAANLVGQMDQLLIRFQEFPKAAVPAALAAGAAMKETGGDVTEVIGKMSDMFDLTNMEAQRLKGLLATTAGGYGAVTNALQAKDTAQVLGMLRESLHQVAPTEEQFNSMRGFYAELYGMSEQAIASIYRMDEARIRQMQVDKALLSAAQASTEPLNEAFDRARMSFSSAFQRFMQGFTALLGILGRPFISVLTMVLNVFSAISLVIAFLASQVQGIISWFENLAVIGPLFTVAFTAASIAIGALALSIAGVMAMNFAKYILGTRLATMKDTMATQLNTLANWANIESQQLQNVSSLQYIKTLTIGIAAKIKDIAVDNMRTAATWGKIVAEKVGITTLIAAATAENTRTGSIIASTVALGKATAGVVWNTIAWMANPVFYIAAAIAGVVVAFKYLGTTLGFVTAAVVALGIAWYASGIGFVLTAGIALVVGLGAALGALVSFIDDVWDAIWGHSLGTGLIMLIDVFKALANIISGTILAVFEGFSSVINSAFQAVRGLVDIGFRGLATVGAGLAALGSGFMALGAGMGLAAPGILAFMVAMGLARIFGFRGEGIAGIMSGIVNAFDFSGLNLAKSVQNMWLMVEFIKGFTAAMLSMMTATGVAELITGGLIGSFLGFFGFGSPMSKLSKRAPTIFGSIQSLSDSIQERMKTVDLGHAAAQIGMFSSIMSSLVRNMKEYERVAIMADKYRRWGKIEIEPMVENVNRIRDALRVELTTMEPEEEAPAVTEAGEDATTLGDVLTSLEKIHKTIASYAVAHEDDELSGMLNNLGWNSNG